MHSLNITMYTDFLYEKRLDSMAVITVWIKIKGAVSQNLSKFNQIVRAKHKKPLKK